MQKIKIVVDSPCDIPDEDLIRYNIDMAGVPINVDGREFIERESFSFEEFYPILENAKTLPATSRVPIGTFQKIYHRAWVEGYTDVIVITLNAGGSGTNESAQMAASLFFDENPETAFSIHIVDSMTYSLAYGYPATCAAIMAQQGSSAAEIVDYLCDAFLRIEIHLVCYTLEYARKSGRITAAAAMAGDILGLRPTITMIDGATKIIAKSRGDKKATQSLIDVYRARRDGKDAHVLVASAAIDEYGQTLKSALEWELGRSVPHYKMGAAIAINAGPRMAAICFLGKKRPHPDNGQSLVMTYKGAKAREKAVIY